MEDPKPGERVCVSTFDGTPCWDFCGAVVGPNDQGLMGVRYDDDDCGTIFYDQDRWDCLMRIPDLRQLTTVDAVVEYLLQEL